MAISGHPNFRTSLSPFLLVFVVSLLSTAQAIGFLGRSNTYARYPPWHACPNASLSFEFKTSQAASAMLVYTDDNGRYDHLHLSLTKGSVRLMITYVAEENRYVNIEANTEPLNDDRWHRVEIRRKRAETILLVDGTQSTKVSLGSDDDVILGDVLKRANYVYFGGIPRGYPKQLPKEFTTHEKFEGSLRNILYFNCTCIPVRASVVDSEGAVEDDGEACEVDNPCPADCPCVSADDGPGCQCDYRRQCLQQATRYYLPCDRVEDGSVINYSGLQAKVEGGAQVVRGVRNNALHLKGRYQWLRLAGASHRQECLGDLSKCQDGYYMGMWLKFFKVPSGRQGVYLSNGGHSTRSHGVAILYASGELNVTFRMPNGREWTAQSREVVNGRWYHVAASWKKDKGLYLYINGELKAQDARPTRRGRTNRNPENNAFYIGRANDNTGTSLLGEVMVDEFVFVAAYKDQKQMREEGPITHYYLSMDEINNQQLSGQGLTAKVYGFPSQVDAKVRKGVRFSGTRQYLDLGDVNGTCLGDPGLCRYGLYVSVWLKFSRLEDGRKAVITAPAFAIYQDGNQLIAVVRKERQHWQTTMTLQIREWYFIELSWTEADGLSLYSDRVRVRYQSSFSNRFPEELDSTNMYVGKDAARGSQYPSCIVDELNIHYADRNTLNTIGAIQTGRPDNLHYDMDSLSLVHNRALVRTLGNPRLGRGKVGSAIILNGQQDALDFRDNSDTCFGNLDLCTQGVLLSLWLRPDGLRNGATYVWTGTSGLAILYDNGKLKVEANTAGHVWDVSTSNFEANKWYFVEVSFHPDRRLELYLNGLLVAESEEGQTKASYDPPAPGQDRFYLGRAAKSGRNAAGAFDELDMWYADRDYLISQGFIQRGRPDSILIDFEELTRDQQRVVHPTLTIRLSGNPRLVPGKVGYALELPGNGEYADLGLQSGTCMGNLARCQQGITVSAWMRFRSFENNMVFLSTGRTGLLLLFRDGYVLAMANNRDQISAPRLETNRWYYIELSWHPNHGLKLFVDNKQIEGESFPFTYKEGAVVDSGRFYIGRPNSGDVPGGQYVTGNFDVDQMEIWNGRREDLLAFGYINRNALGCENFPMDSSQGNRVVHPSHDLRLMNGATLADGRRGRALQLTGQGQYLDMGYQRDSCLGNLTLCPHGFTLSVWLRPNALSENMHFISAPSFFLFYEVGQLSAEFNTNGRSWVVSSYGFHTGEWQRVTLTWQPLKGLRMFIDDRQVDWDRGSSRTPTLPASGRLYIGRNLEDTRLTANVDVDDLQICNDDLDHLIAAGEYEVEILPVIISFDSLRDGGYIDLRDRQIIAFGNVRLTAGLRRNTKAVYLNGRNQYLDFGNNFTCAGDLRTCREGVTFRVSVKPEQLQEGMYLVDSMPVSLYYRNGRLHADMRQGDDMWTVDTPEIRLDRWSRVEMTWHPELGLALYVNGVRMAYRKYPNQRNTREAQGDNAWKTFLGRPIDLAGGSYADVHVDSVETYNAHRNYIGEDTYLNFLFPYLENLERTTPRPVFTLRPVTTPKPARTTTPRQPINVPDDRVKRSRIIRLDGKSYVLFNNSQIPQQYLTKTNEGHMSIMFLTDRPEGLLWFQEDPTRRMYLALEDGHVVFVNDDLRARRRDKTVIGEDENVRFDDYRWHEIMLRRTGREVDLTVDDRYRKEYTFPSDVQFLSPAMVWLGGSQNTPLKTNRDINDNFYGGIADVIYVTSRRDGPRIIQNEVNLISLLSRGITEGNVTEVGGGPDPVRPTAPPVTQPPNLRRTTSISVIDQGVGFQLPPVTLRSGSSISFSFKTLNQDGLILFSGNKQAAYFAIELVDGRLYFVHKFGILSYRTPFSQKIVADGQVREVEVRFYPNGHIDLRMDNIRKRLDLRNGERMPSNLGTLYAVGMSQDRFPWNVWSRQGYVGCFIDLRVDSGLVDFEDWILQTGGKVVGNCEPVSQECTLSRPCVQGQCRNTMLSYLCDCSATAFRGSTCSLDAWSALFNGSTSGNVEFSKTLETHKNDINLRFRTPSRDGLLFETSAKNSNDFLRASMDRGQIKVETNIGGEVKTLRTGSNLNDLQWHTLYIQRRGNELEIWVDDQPREKGNLGGQDYFLDIDNVHVGGVEGSDNGFIGYLQNFQLARRDILDGLRGSVVMVDRFQVLPPLLYHAVTFPDLESFLSLQALDNQQDLTLQFMFKTKEPSGVLLFTSGQNKGYLVVELFEGNLYIQFSAGGSQPLRVVSHQKVNDDQWHAVTIRRTGGQNQFQLTVDGVTSSVSYAGNKALVLDENVYIGGVPQAIFQREEIKKGVFSRTGFRGCLASMDLSGRVINLSEVAKISKVDVYDSCRPIVARACTADSCKNFGKCVEVGANTFKCDCSMSAHSGSVCLDEPAGYRYQNFSRQGKVVPGLLIYSFPVQTTIGSARDNISFGVMTKQDNAILLRIFSEIFNDYIEFRLRNGYVEVNYDTDGDGGQHKVIQQTQKVNDGDYHIVRFIRMADKADLYVDKAMIENKHDSPHGHFDRMSKVYIGGGYDVKQGKILEGFDGIIGGLHINGLLVFTEANARVNTRDIGDVVLAPRPFNLATWWGDVEKLPGPTTTPTPTKPDPTSRPIGPGGGGLGWTAKPGGVDVQVYPGGDTGTGVLVPGKAGGGDVAMAGFMAPSSLSSGPGPRAGAVAGTVLALLVLASALMWAFVRCKPGWCWCLKPPEPDPIVSMPLLSATNKGAVIAAGRGVSGVSGAGGAITGLGDGPGVNGASAGIGGANAFTNYYLSSPSAAGAGGGGTALGTGTMTSTKGSVSAGGNFSEPGRMRSVGGSVDRMDGMGGAIVSPVSPVSLQSYHYEGAGESTTADYDLVTGIHPLPASYQTNTMATSRGGSVSSGFANNYHSNTMSTTRGGSVSGGAFDTLQTQYNYSVRNLGSVSGMHQVTGYRDSHYLGVPAGVLEEEVRVDCCLMAGDGRSVVTGSSLGPPQVWNMQSGELLHKMQGEMVGSTMLHLALSDQLLVGAINADLPANQLSVPKGVNNYLLQIWDFLSGKPMAMPKPEVCSALTMMRDRDNDKVVFARTDMFGAGTNVVVWDLVANEAIKDMSYNAPVGHNNDFVRFLAVSQSNRYVIAGFTNSEDKSAEFIVFDMMLTANTVSNMSIVHLEADPECTAVLPNDEAVTGMRNGELIIWSLRTAQPTRQLMAESKRHAHTAEVKAVALSEDSRFLVSGSVDGTVKLFDMTTERHRHTFHGHTDEVWCCTISANNEIIVSGSRDKTIRLWKLKDGSAFSSFHAGVDIFHLTMSRDGSTIVGLGDKFGARKLVMLEVKRTKVRRQVEEED